jgi:4-hydroxy-tetrahydrodipicolinate synthase
MKQTVCFMELRGVLPVLQVPYAGDGAIDLATLRREIDWVFAARVQGVAIGMASEIVRLTDEERDRLVREVVRLVAGRGPVVAGAGGESAVQAVRHARVAEEAGASALMVPPPFLTRCGEEGLVRYYETLLEATRLPVMIQDASGYLGGPVPTGVQLALFRRHPDRILFKPEGPAMSATFSALRDATGGKARVFEGRGGLSLVDSYRRGIAGVLPGSDVPWAIVALWEALEKDDEVRARRVQGALALFGPIFSSLDAFLAVEKALLVKQGVFPNAIVRGPVGFALDREAEAEVFRVLELLRAACA